MPLMNRKHRESPASDVAMAKPAAHSGHLPPASRRHAFGLAFPARRPAGEGGDRGDSEGGKEGPRPRRRWRRRVSRKGLARPSSRLTVPPARSAQPSITRSKHSPGSLRMHRWTTRPAIYGSSVFGKLTKSDQIPLHECLGDYWGELCGSRERAAAWADQLIGTVEMSWKRLTGSREATSMARSHA